MDFAETSIVSWFLGGVYTYTAGVIGWMLYKLGKCSVKQYNLVMSKKTLFVSFWWAVMATCATVAYQNFSGDGSEYIMWWRLFLISFISIVTTRLSVYTSQVKDIVPDDL